jgi:hypothetical protein
MEFVGIPASEAAAGSSGQQLQQPVWWDVRIAAIKRNQMERKQMKM